MILGTGKDDMETSLQHKSEVAGKETQVAQPSRVTTTLQRVIAASCMSMLAAIAVINDTIFIAVIIFMTVGGLYEFFYLIKKKGIPIYSYTGVLIGVLIPLSINFRFELTKNWELLFTILAFLAILFLQFARKDNTNAIVGISTTLFGVLYVSWLFSFSIKIRYSS